MQQGEGIHASVGHTVHTLCPPLINNSDLKVSNVIYSPTAYIYHSTDLVGISFSVFDHQSKKQVINSQKTKEKKTRMEMLKCIIPSNTGAKNVLSQTPYNYCGLRQLLIPHSLFGG